MYHSGVTADIQPEKVKIEYLPGGIRKVRMTDNVEEYHDEESPERTYWRYDEVVFDLPENAEVDRAGIEGEFYKWWEYGKAQNPPEPTPAPPQTVSGLAKQVEELKKQNQMLEDCLLEMSEIVYA